MYSSKEEDEERELEMQSKKRKLEEENKQKMIERMKKHKEIMKASWQLKKRKLTDYTQNTMHVPLSALESLPDEILRLVVESLDLRSLIHLSNCSKKFNSFSQDGSLWESMCKFRWPKLSTSEVYRDLIDGQTIQWKVSFRKKYEKEMFLKKKAETFQRIEEILLMDCKYCNMKKARIIDSSNTTSVFLVSNRTPRYTITIECSQCGKKWTEGRGNDN